MVSFKEFTDVLEEIAPPELAEDYDNVGLLIGDKNVGISKVLISLDTDLKTVEHAVKIGADMVLSHHPLLFRPLKQILCQDSIGKTAIELIRNNIQLYAMHTNFDSVKNGLCDYFLNTICRALPLASIEGEFPNGIGRIAKLPQKISLFELLGQVKQNLQLKTIRFVGDENAEVETIAVCNGGGADLIYDAFQKCADVYITGDLKYHHARYAYECERMLIEVPHYEAEILFCRYLANHLREKFGDRCEFVFYENENPWKTI